mgnify:CR=1 FL=1
MGDFGFLLGIGFVFAYFGTLQYGSRLMNVTFDPGVPGDYKPGVAAIYRDLEGPCWPVATNSGVHWPAHGFRRYPGTVVYEFLPAIPAGLKRAEFMTRLEADIEAASAALLMKQ